jgi:hypothetical protein
MAFEKSKEIVRSFKLELNAYQRVLRDKRTLVAAKLLLALAVGYLYAVRFNSGLCSSNRSPGRCDHCTCASFRRGSLGGRLRSFQSIESKLPAKMRLVQITMPILDERRDKLREPRSRK